ncbi:hypothetical protein Pyrde_0565 [Pyrodictium delaneyi]|uniref:Uncharacterized protein n=1 Tax=Pyrodictium delaneyi TaxID=1273541 RepID=A0A0P0N3G9_9CREN|nr:hypothetical protein [Pyrodictium delaneyi]ALL00615.1 hypothetical protein Pyrde_0565 [Pyrodictium delaneyi]OWJ54074.1 hypothetical protein Pdsh_09430 [Pyrodictium delaneyi]
MPQLPAGSTIYPIELLIKSPETIQKIALTASSDNCRCMIVDTPFTATVENKGFIIDQVIGVGSIICSPGCGDSDIVLHSSTWSYGRIIARDTNCIAAAPSDFVMALKSVGISVREVDYEEFFDNVLKYGANGVMVLFDELNRLEITRENGLCGSLYSHNPLHPAGVVGKPGLHCCIDELYEIVGPRSRLMSPILAVGKKIVISQIKGMGEAVILSFNPASSSGYASLAGWLGALYACGSTTEHL